MLQIVLGIRICCRPYVAAYSLLSMHCSLGAAVRTLHSRDYNMYAIVMHNSLCAALDAAVLHSILYVAFYGLQYIRYSLK